MRVIAGEKRGKKLFSPKDSKIRPTSDRVKESIFNMLASEIDHETIVYDLFSGSGSLGIEALSRGAKKAYFSDTDKESIELTKKNIDICKFQDRSQVIHADYRNALPRIPEKADIIFIDPPYALRLWIDGLRWILEMDKLNKSGLLVIEHDTNDVLHDIPEILTLIKEKTYGATSVSVFEINNGEAE